MKSLKYWVPRIGAIFALIALLAACGAVPTAQSQSGSAGDARPNENSALDQDLLRQVDQQIASAKARNEDVSSAQSLRDSAVSLAQQGSYAEANGNLKIAAQLLGVLRPVGNPPTAVPRPAIASAPVVVPTGDEQGNVVLDAKFNSDQDLAGWNLVGVKVPNGKPLWTVQDGTLTQRGVDGVETLEELTGFVTGDPSWTDVTVRVNALSRGTRELGVIVRQNGESYYRFRTLVFGTGTNQGNRILEKVVNGQVTRLAVFEGPELDADTWYTLAITARGSTLSCYINGKLLGSVDDTSLSAGRAGVSTLAMSGAFFKNLQVIGR